MDKHLEDLHNSNIFQMTSAQYYEIIHEWEIYSNNKRDQWTLMKETMENHWYDFSFQTVPNI